jgi:hypothetical protein
VFHLCRIIGKIEIISVFSLDGRSDARTVGRSQKKSAVGRTVGWSQKKKIGGRSDGRMVSKNKKQEKNETAFYPPIRF